MKILIVGPLPPPYTGQSVSFKKLKEELESDQHISHVYHVNTAPQKAHITGKASLNRLLETSTLVLKFLVLLIFKQPSVIYLTKGSTKNGFMRDYILLIIKKIFLPKARFIVHLKGGNYDTFYASCTPKYQRRIVWFLENVSWIIVLGKSLVKMYDFLPSVHNKITVIENALTIDSSLSIESLQDKHKEKIVQLLFLSNLIYTKGYGHLLEACKILLKRGVNNFHLTFAGEFMKSPDDPNTIDIDAYQQNFLSSIFSAEINAYVSYNGPITGNQKKLTLENAHIFILPTQYHVEGQPVSIIEAMAYGCAIIATNYRSIPDLIEDQANGMYIDYENPSHLADALESLIKNREKLAQYSMRSIQTYQEKFRWNIHSQKMMNLFMMN